jgi:hypothetical protein
MARDRKGKELARTIGAKQITGGELNIKRDRHVRLCRSHVGGCGDVCLFVFEKWKVKNLGWLQKL